MFSHLIESSSHRREFRRRGSFFLFTTASYALLFVIAGVISIYAYDARMEDQNLELAMIMPLVDPPAETPREVSPAATQPIRDDKNPNAYIRKQLTATVAEPDVAPDHISTIPNPDPPRPRNGIVIIGNQNVDPLGDGRSSSDSGDDTSSTARRGPTVVITDPPAPVQVAKPVPKVIRKRVLNGEALVLPKPAYPPMAIQIRLQGTVNVQVLIDEKGKVISATPISGHPFLTPAAKAAAFQARFSPTMLGDEPVKVSGVITYNFVLQ